MLGLGRFHNTLASICLWLPLAGRKECGPGGGAPVGKTVTLDVQGGKVTLTQAGPGVPPPGGRHTRERADLGLPFTMFRLDKRLSVLYPGT